MVAGLIAVLVWFLDPAGEGPVAIMWGGVALSAHSDFEKWLPPSGDIWSVGVGGGGGGGVVMVLRSVAVEIAVAHICPIT